jgi:hypothetical protein
MYHLGKEDYVKNRGLLWVMLVVVFLVGVAPLFAADPVIRHGIDTFTTTASGKTFYDFAKNPIPADFFCAGSATFTEKVAMRGLPLAADAKANLHGADTVIERLDDAVFDARHIAVTRLQVRALSLVSIKPIQTSCGAFHAYLTLAGKQRVTTMKIFRTQEGGGHFVAPLAIDARVSFVPVKAEKIARKLEVRGSLTFPAAPISWSLTAGKATKRVGTVVVDTDGDLVPDTKLAGTSNFFPGWSPNGIEPAPKLGQQCTYVCEPYSCHADPASGEQHCTGPVYTCGQCP